MTTNTLKLIEKSAVPLAEKAFKYQIKTKEDLTGAVKLLSDMNVILDRITTEKEKVTKPLNEALKQERNRWKPIESTYERAIASVRTAMTAFQTAAIKKQKEDEAKIAGKVASGKLRMETGVRKMNELDAPETTVVSDSGMVKFRTEKKFEVVDVTKLPKEYILANETAIRAAMKEGKELSGVRYFEEQVPVNFR